jgi:hypothetical protein
MTFKMKAFLPSSYYASLGNKGRILTLTAPFELQPDQQQKERSRLLTSVYDENLWHRRMLKGYGTPSSPSNMNHDANKAELK